MLLPAGAVSTLGCRKAAPWKLPVEVARWWAVRKPDLAPSLQEGTGGSRAAGRAGLWALLPASLRPSRGPRLGEQRGTCAAAPHHAGQRRSQHGDPDKPSPGSEQAE